MTSEIDPGIAAVVISVRYDCAWFEIEAVLRMVVISVGLKVDSLELGFFVVFFFFQFVSLF